jgi:hypothetical protein
MTALNCCRGCQALSPRRECSPVFNDTEIFSWPIFLIK